MRLSWLDLALEKIIDGHGYDKMFKPPSYELQRQEAEQELNHMTNIELLQLIESLVHPDD